jgi:hypothetical protein
MNQQKLLEWFNYNKYNDYDQQQGWNLIEDAEEPGIPHPFVTGKPLEMALKRAMVQAKEENRRQLAKNPNLQDFKSARNKKQNTG